MESTERENPMVAKTDLRPARASEASTYPGLQTQPTHNSTRNPLFNAARRILRAQFGCPKGLWGSLVGKVMALRPSNNARIRWTISLLDVTPQDRILEIGMGPGIAISLLSEIATEGFIAGIDHSEVMVRQATKRNINAINAGRVTLQMGSASDLPQFATPFDKVFTINSIHFWADPIDCLRSVRSLLKPGGLMAITIQPRSRGATDLTTRLIGEELVTDLTRAGFSHGRLEIKKALPVAVACAMGNA